MCYVIQEDLMDCQIRDYTTDGNKDFQTFYYSWRLDTFGFTVRKWKYSNNDSEWKVLYSCPTSFDVKQGWCTSYRTDSSLSHYKQREGWYTNGKEDGEHLVYSLSYGPGREPRNYIQEVSVYELGVKVQMRKYNETGHLLHVWNYKNRRQHGITYNYLQRFASLYVNGEIVVEDLADIHIDYLNITEADYFTLSMLGM